MSSAKKELAPLQSIDQVNQSDVLWTPVPGTYEVSLDLVCVLQAGIALLGVGQEFVVLSGEHRGRRFSRFPDFNPYEIYVRSVLLERVHWRSCHTVRQLAKVISGSEPESYRDALEIVKGGASERVRLKVRVTRLKSGSMSVRILRRLKAGEPGEREPQTGPTLPADRSVK